MQKKGFTLNVNCSTTSVLIFVYNPHAIDPLRNSLLVAIDR